MPPPLPPFFSSKNERAGVLDQDEKARIQKGILAGFSRHAQRYYEHLFLALDTGPIENRQVAYEKAFLEQSFLVKRTVVPGFDRYVLNRVRASHVIKRQRHAILKACLIPVLRRDGMYIEEMVVSSEETSDEDMKEGFTRRHVQRLFHNYFPETFFQDKEEAGRALGDQRLAPFQSVFSTHELPKMSKSKLAADYYDQDYSRLMASGKQRQQIMLSSWLRLVTPEFLESILNFRAECVGVVKEAGGFDDRAVFLLNEINSFSLILLVLYANLNSILALEWFRTQRNMTKTRLLSRAFPLHYSLQDGIKARQLLTILTGQQEGARKLLEEGALALAAHGLRDSSVSLMQRCLELKELPPLALGITSENIAVLHRENGNFKLMVGLMKRALEYYREAGDQYRVCVALKNLGEAEWKLGFTPAALDYFARAERQGSELTDQEQRFNLYCNLAVAARRIEEREMEIGYLKKSLAAIPEDQVDKLLAIDQRLGELTR